MVALPPYKQALKLFFSLISLSLVVCLLYLTTLTLIQIGCQQPNLPTGLQRGT